MSGEMPELNTGTQSCEAVRRVEEHKSESKVRNVVCRAGFAAKARTLWRERLKYSWICTNIWCSGMSLLASAVVSAKHCL